MPKLFYVPKTALFLPASEKSVNMHRLPYCGEDGDEGGLEVLDGSGNYSTESVNVLPCTVTYVHW